MSENDVSQLVAAQQQQGSRLLQPRSWVVADWVFAAGVLALLLPTMIDVARLTWSTEQGGHGPIILTTGLWLIWREAKEADAPIAGRTGIFPAIATAFFLLITVLARITGTLEVEGYAMYATFISAAYVLLGGAFLRKLWFPLFYLAFIFPPPDTVVAALTQPVKIEISQWAVKLLYMLGYPIANSGVMIQIAQYELLVAAACAGLNSLLSLAAICLFYVYLRHRGHIVNMTMVGLLVLPVALFANFVRVIILILMTYYWGEATAQGFLHDFAGLTMFAIALGTIILVDELLTKKLSGRLAAK